ncbi:MAG: hypothetical protein DRN29_03205 [Thermoplasmata archaeon]|nr:MAG: hypothetical protein DRN29_03205 [Thermoplasmata archaeon]
MKDRMKSLTVRIDEETYRRLDDFCKREGYTKNGLIRKLIRSFLDGAGREECFSLDHPYWKLIGAFSDDAEDVSENKDKYVAQAYER